MPSRRVGVGCLTRHAGGISETMTQDEPELYDLTRRKVLGGLTAVGVASVGAGLGTSAYFSDTETFPNNSLTAGALDLVVDWEEHYSDWSEDEIVGIDPEDIVMENPEDSAFTPFPAGAAEPTVWVRNDDGADGPSSLDRFMDNTTLESYPDADNNAVQDDLDLYDACRDFANVGTNQNGGYSGTDLDPRQSKGPEGATRTLNEDTVVRNGDDSVSAIKPLVSLDDVKPGDFGELTLSMHLCDNPGYIWLQGVLNSASENGLTEPEASDPDEDGANVTVTDLEDADADLIELLDAVQTMVWYDEDGDNVFEPGGEGRPVCVQLVLDASGSMAGDRNDDAIAAGNLLAEQIINADSNNSVGVTFFSGDGYDNGAQLQQSVGHANADDVAATQSVINTLPADGNNTAIGEGILTADEDLANCPPDTQHVMIVITDGENNVGTSPSAAADDVTGPDGDDHTDEIFAVGTGQADDGVLSGFARPNDDVHKAFASDSAELNEILAQIAQVLIGEEMFFEGSLRELLTAVSTDNGIPLDGNRASDFAEVDGDNLPNPGDHADRDPYVASTTNMVGVSWWLPVDHANEIQTDSVEFDLGFYTEQARHNSGAGQA